MNELWLGTLERLGLAWWIEIITESPSCTYYFGPYLKVSDAEAEKQGFIDDLEKEGARNIKFTIKRCRPSRLTIPDEKPIDSAKNPSIAPILSSQV